jgi:hypothetical protein
LQEMMERRPPHHFSPSSAIPLTQFEKLIDLVNIVGY